MKNQLMYFKVYFRNNLIEECPRIYFFQSFQQYSILLILREIIFTNQCQNYNQFKTYCSVIITPFNCATKNNKICEMIKIQRVASSQRLLKQIQLRFNFVTKIQQFLLINYSKIMRINAKVILNKNFQQTRKKEVSRDLQNKQQAINVNNIRESGYKIIRHRSNRTEHSLQTKKPLLLNHSSSKYLSNKCTNTQPKTPYSLNSKQPEKHYFTSQNIAAFNQTIQTQHNKRLDNSAPHKNINETFTYQKESLFNYNHTNNRHNQQISCIKDIWRNIKILKQKQFFLQAIIQLQKIVQNIIVKMAEDSNCLTQRKSQSLQNKKTSKMKQFEIQTLFDLLSTKKMQKINMTHCQKDSYKSSFDSLRIQNEQAHKYQFLNLYQQSQLNEISYRLSNRPSNFNASPKQISVCQSIKDNQSEKNSQDRIYLKSIIKKNKKGSGFQKTTDRPLNEGFCKKTCNKQNKIDDAYSCGIFECDTTKKQQSAGSSESKRQVLNQIISMLNYKYQKNIKIEFNKVIV